MKSRLLVSTTLAIALLGFAVSASAQVGGGVRGAINFQNLVIEPKPLGVEYKSTMGFGAGGFLIVNPKGAVGALIEGMWNQRGGRGRVDTPEYTEYKMQYVDINALVHARVAKMPNGDIHVYGGPSFGFNLKAESTFGDGPVTDNDVAIKDKDMGLLIGGGARFGHLLVDARYLIGLVNVIEDDFANDQKLKFRTLSITFGVIF